MATVVFCPVTFNLAETTRMIQVAQALDPAHRVVFMGYETDFVDLIRDAGFDYRACEPAWTRAERDQAIAFDQGRSFRSPFTPALVGARVELERRLIRELDAAAVVTGSNLTSFISARAEGVPLFYPVPFPLTRPQVAQAKHLALVGGRGWIARAADRVATSVFRWIYNSAPLAPRAFTSVAKANGVPPLRTVSDLLTADRNLVTEMPWEMDGFELPDGFELVGPIFAHLESPMPDLVAELADAPEPLVYLGLGSSADRKLALDAARALGTLPINVVAPIRHYLEPGDAVPSNVHVTQLLPAHRLGGLVDAAVLHGGQGTVQTACATGVPFVGMGLQPEQTWHVRACERRGNAIAVSPKHVARPEFLAAVRRVLDDPGIRAAADDVREAYRGADGAAASARLIERAVALKG
ncbi:UDP:flavonoid glycosyltransferase YjiC (YdhE family) [Agromyces hippuratus]|uniref:UDP:flavonoid glycosyltransferase YjiC (YdhE family) n=1 Tax=Agromyces hippuratus TaxID=286438 RepID=A0A852WWL9_9MICO|nr:nucleotide disphospho-sugar-binding domain-containing protein [Agromyces hippuratus]NYG22349.1 UDP:flavonoid glycosyltransferase YjiC (YdhE family) [Agromyces hippuratus]